MDQMATAPIVQAAASKRYLEPNPSQEIQRMSMDKKKGKDVDVPIVISSSTRPPVKKLQ